MPQPKTKIDGNVQVCCSNCGRRHWLSPAEASRDRRCDRCCRTKVCNRCGQQYRRSHKCKAKETLLFVSGGDSTRPPRLGPSHRHRFCTVECSHDATILHLADIRVNGPIIAHCSKRRNPPLFATHLIRAIPIGVWGILDVDHKQTSRSAGPWCRRCLALATRLLGDKTRLRLARPT
jgi:hypothetical protein